MIEPFLKKWRLVRPYVRKNENFDDQYNSTPYHRGDMMNESGHGYAMHDTRIYQTDTRRSKDHPFLLTMHLVPCSCNSRSSSRERNI